MKIFGREPAFYTSLLAAALSVILSIDKFDLTPEQAACIVAVATAVLGFYTAWVTDETLLGVGTGLAQSVLALAVAYGADLTTDKTTAIIAFVTVLLGGYERTQNSPAAIPGFTSGVRAPAAPPPPA